MALRLCISLLLLSHTVQSSQREQGRVFSVTAMQEPVAAVAGSSLGEDDMLFQCYEAAIDRIEADCAALVGERLSKAALELYNCVAASEGRVVFPCAREATIGTCTQPMDPITWSTYQQIVSRTLGLCQRVHGDAWRRATAHTIDRLGLAAADHVAALEALGAEHTALQQATAAAVARVGDLQEDLVSKATALGEHVASVGGALENAFSAGVVRSEELLRGQHDALQRQVELLATSSAVNETVAATRATLALMQSELDRRNERLMQVAGDIFAGLDRIAHFKAMLLAQLFDFQSVLFYVFGLVLACLLTTTHRLSRARLWLFVLLTATLCMERAFVRLLPPTFDLVGSLWLVRKATVFLACALLSWAFATHTDPHSATVAAIARLEQRLAAIAALESKTTAARAVAGPIPPHAVLALEWVAGASDDDPDYTPPDAASDDDE